MRTVILASSSPYRKALLARLKFPFECYSPNIDESPLPDENIDDLVNRLSHEKAAAAAQAFPQSICIGSDELAVLDQAILGKPLTHPQAVSQLQAMSGQTVHFYTGLCVFDAQTSQSWYHCATTSAHFKTLTPEMINTYLAIEQPYQSAASFKSETLGCALLEHMDSDDPSAIIGLPLIALAQLLAKAGFDVLDPTLRP